MRPTSDVDAVLCSCSPFIFGVSCSDELEPLLSTACSPLTASPFTLALTEGVTLLSGAACDKLLLLFLVSVDGVLSVESNELWSFGTVCWAGPSTTSEPDASWEVRSGCSGCLLAALRDELEKGVLGEALLVCEDADSETDSLGEVVVSEREFDERLRNRCTSASISCFRRMSLKARWRPSDDRERFKGREERGLITLCNPLSSVDRLRVTAIGALIVCPEGRLDAMSGLEGPLAVSSGGVMLILGDALVLAALSLWLGISVVLRSPFSTLLKPILGCDVGEGVIWVPTEDNMAGALRTPGISILNGLCKLSPLLVPPLPPLVLLTTSVSSLCGASPAACTVWHVMLSTCDSDCSDSSCVACVHSSFEIGATLLVSVGVGGSIGGRCTALSCWLMDWAGAEDDLATLLWAFSSSSEMMECLGEDSTDPLPDWLRVTGNDADLVRSMNSGCPPRSPFGRGSSGRGD